MGNKLFAVYLGGRAPRCNTELHDVVFVVGESIEMSYERLMDKWFGDPLRLHIDSWIELRCVDGYRISLRPSPAATDRKLYFINLGGYKPGEFEEYHYKTIVAGPDKGAAVRRSKETAFYKHVGFKGAESHIDDKYGIDVDDAHEIDDILPPDTKGTYMLEVLPATGGAEDELHIGYVKLEKLK